jgi:hypothetical protein
MIELLVVAQLNFGCGGTNFNTIECQNQRLLQEQARTMERRQHQEQQQRQQIQTPIVPRPFCDYVNGGCR